MDDCYELNFLYDREDDSATCSCRYPCLCSTIGAGVSGVNYLVG
jgi:hypothetical protein